MKIKIASITLDKDSQPRTEIDNGIIEEYAELIKSNVEFPPVIVFEMNGIRWLADGWHRVFSHKKAGKVDIEAEIMPGGKREAVLYSCGVNADHGKRRTNADKRRAVETLLKDSEWQKWSDREIARRCAVSHVFVQNIRPITGNISSEKVYRTKHGTTTVMNTENIGKKEQPIFETPEMPFDDKPRESIIRFNKTNENIEWAAWSWNPVTGCKHDCQYCYARDIANRFDGNFEPKFHESRLNAPENTNPDMSGHGGRNVFVCSMADLFGSWVPNEWIFKVMNKVKDNPQWTFLFLTKNPRRYSSIQFPDNAWIGTTVDKQSRVNDAEKYMMQANARVKFLSCEPMNEPLKFNDLSIFNWVIIGARSQTTTGKEFQPDFKWVWDLTNQAFKAGCKVYWKPNLKCRPTEYPEA